VLWQHCLSDRLRIEILAHGLRTTSALFKKEKEKRKKDGKKEKIKLSNKWNFVEK
jgi:hypothetical protein